MILKETVTLPNYMSVDTYTFEYDVDNFMYRAIEHTVYADKTGEWKPFKPYMYDRVKELTS